MMVRRRSVVAMALVVLLVSSLGVGTAGASPEVARGTGGAPSTDRSPGPSALPVSPLAVSDPMFHALNPARLMDTRSGRDTIDGVAAGGGSFSGERRFQVTGRGGVPALGVGAVVLNVTATGPSNGGYLTVHPSDGGRPTASNVNFTAGATVATAAIAKVSASGEVSVFASVRTDVIIDVAGWFPEDSDYEGLNPARLVDTRSGRDTIDGTDAGTGRYGGERRFRVTDRAGVPASGVGAVVLNVTATGPSNGGYLTVHPSDEERPTASNVNFAPGQTVANLVIAKVSTNGEVTVFASTTTDVIIDIAGWFSDDSDYHALNPARLVDTRSGRDTIDGTDAGTGSFILSRKFRVTDRGGAPLLGIGAVVLNVTATGPSNGGYLTVHPSDEERPTASNVNFAPGQTVANLVIAKVSTNGEVTVFASTTTDVIIDIAGWLPTEDYDRFRVGSISTGIQHSCAVTTTGGAKCWGTNSFGELGTESVSHASTPVDVDGLTAGVASIAVGSNHTCALTTGGAVKCWGLNVWKQLGTGSTDFSSATPTEVLGLSSGIASVSTRANHTCVTTVLGAALCWGMNNAGQLGDETLVDRSAPTPVEGLSSGVAAIAAGDDYSCAVTTSGAAKCWGDNSSGQLGDGTTEQRSTPTQVQGLSSGIESISVGYRASPFDRNHTCAVPTSGVAKCWGDNSSGQLGDGTTEQRLVPTEVEGLSSEVGSVSVGMLTTCAVLRSSAVECWGDNQVGQLGNGSPDDRSLEPVMVHGLTSGVSYLSSGRGYNCAVVGNGTARCWGLNEQNLLGDGSEHYSRSIPVTVYGTA